MLPPHRVKPWHVLSLITVLAFGRACALVTSWLVVVEIRFEVSEGGSHAAAAAHGDLVGGHLRHGPLGGEECRQLLGGGRRELKEKMLGI